MQVDLYRETDQQNEDENMVFLVSWDEVEYHPNGTVYPVYYLGYGDPVMLLCSKAWIDDQEKIKETQYDGKTDFESLYEHYWKDIIGAEHETK